MDHVVVDSVALHRLEVGSRLSRLYLAGLARQLGRSTTPKPTEETIGDQSRYQLFAAATFAEVGGPVAADQL